MPSCKSCQKPIRWGIRAGMSRKDKGAFVPLEPGPVDIGIYAIIDDRLVLWDPSHGQQNRWAPHNAFCEARGIERKDYAR